MREGQVEFRQGLLDAYEKLCAMTGSAVLEIHSAWAFKLNPCLRVPVYNDGALEAK